MSIIYGYINLNSKPLERSVLETMKHAMDFWGPDGDSLWIENTCGIGNLLYYNTPEAIFEKMPFTDATGNLVLSAGARIDNREELYIIFNIPLGQRLTMPDSALMMKAYEKWGEDCADHLVGDWAMAVWDKVKRKLFLARDHHGITALYYYKGEDFFVFSSSLKGILCLPQVPKKVNEYKIAQLLVNWNEGGPTTCYLDIMRLPPAHTLTLADGKLTTNRYWYLEHTPEVRLKNDQEYADMFLHLYTEAVRHRLRSHRPVGATLSSGLDSGSVCILAAKELAKEGKRLQAYTAVPLYDVPAPPGRIANEGPYALALAEKLGNVDVTLCNAENVGVLEGIDILLNVIDEPNFAALNAHWLIDIFNNNHKDSLGAILIGPNGNYTVSWPTRDIMKRQKIRSRLSEFKSYVNVINYKWLNDFLIDTHFAKINSLNIKFSKVINPLRSSYFLRRQMIGAGVSSVGDKWYLSGLYSKTEYRDPTIDLSLLKLFFGIPRGHQLNYNRLLKNETFQKLFEDKILSGAFRGKQASDIKLRLEKENELFQIKVNDLKSSKIMRSFVDVSKLNRLVTKNNENKVLIAISILLFIKKLGFISNI